MFFWPCIMNWLYINYQPDALIIIYSKNNILLYMFRASSVHLQEDTVVHMQLMVLSLSMRVPGGLSVQSLSEFSLKLCTDREENSILWINNNQCIKLVISVYTPYHFNFSKFSNYISTSFAFTCLFLARRNSYSTHWSQHFLLNHPSYKRLIKFLWLYLSHFFRSINYIHQHRPVTDGSYSISTPHTLL
jgi:hypothetical protein